MTDVPLDWFRTEDGEIVLAPADSVIHRYVARYERADGTMATEEFYSATARDAFLAMQQRRANRAMTDAPLREMKGPP